MSLTEFRRTLLGENVIDVCKSWLASLTRLQQLSRVNVNKNDAIDFIAFHPHGIGRLLDNRSSSTSFDASTRQFALSDISAGVPDELGIKTLYCY